MFTYAHVAHRSTHNICARRISARQQQTRKPTQDTDSKPLSILPPADGVEMGELDEKETVPANAPTTTTPTSALDVISSVSEPKETESLLAGGDNNKSANSPTAAATSANGGADSPKSEAASSTLSTTVTIEKEPIDTKNDDTIVAAVADSTAEITAATAAAVEGDKEKDALLPTDESGAAKVSLTTKEGREVKPKKIPIGGIKMPGFFTRKPKASPTAAAAAASAEDGADSELLQKPTEEGGDVEAQVATAAVDETAKDGDETTEKPAAGLASGLLASLRAIRNPFAKRAAAEAVKTEDDEVPEIKIGGECGCGLFFIRLKL